MQSGIFRQQTRKVGQHLFWGLLQPRRNEIHIGGGLKEAASEESKNGGPGACPRENFS